MITLNKKLTAKDFQLPLLAVLFHMSSEDAGVPTPFKDTYEPVMAHMGITALDAHGINSDGKEKVAQWIQWAYKNLKRTGFVEDVSRGQWALSDTGLAEAIKRNTRMRTHSNLGDVRPSRTDVSSPISPGQVEGEYHSDPYIRTLAAKFSPCFGHYSHKSGVCQRCTLQGSCINYLAAELSRWAAVLKREDAEEQRKLHAVKTAVENPTQATGSAVTSKPPTNFDWSEWDIGKVRRIIAKAEGICPVCNQKVVRNSHAIWLKAKVEKDGRRRAVLFHKECGPKK